MDPVDPQIDEVDLGQLPVLERLASSCHCVVSRVTVAADSPAPEPRNCSNAGAKSREDSPCRYSSGSTSATFGDFRDHAGRDLRREPLPLTGFRVDPLVVHPRCGHRDRTGTGRHRPLLVVAVADHQPVPVLVADISELIDVRRDLGLQRGREHLPGTVADQLVQQRHRGRLLLRTLLSNYREHGRTFPTGVGALALLEDLLWGLSGRYVLPAAPDRHDARIGPSTGFKHCSTCSAN